LIAISNLVGQRCDNSDPSVVVRAGNELQGRRVDDSWLLFFFVGLFAQLVDGAFGMAFGVTATTVMLSFGCVYRELRPC
jgi:hypothetical protein